MFRPITSFGLCVCSAIAASITTSSARAQVLTFTSRNGMNVAYCGPLGGPATQHNFAAPTATHDPISLSHPGSPDMPASAASTQFDATPTAFGLSLAGSGSASRGALQGQGFGAYSVADTRDQWEFSLTAPARFTFSVTLNASSSSATSAPTSAAWLWGAYGGGAQITLDPGSPPNVFGDFISGAGTVAITASGTMSAGHYFVSLQGRADGHNTYPYNGSYSNSLALGLTCGTVNSYCTSGTTGNGCTAQMQATGAASASATSGFTITAANMEGAAPGLLFYGVNGRTALPWGTSSSFVCVKAPTQRMGLQTSTGTPGACNGAMSLDWNAFVSSHPSALGVPLSVGGLVQAQCWFRDTASPKTTSLSDAIEFAVCP